MRHPGLRQPGTFARFMGEKTSTAKAVAEKPVAGGSPPSAAVAVQLSLLNPNASYFDGADLLISATAWRMPWATSTKNC